MLTAEATLEAQSFSVIAKTLRSLFLLEPNVPEIMLAKLEPLDVPPAYTLTPPDGIDRSARLR